MNSLSQNILVSGQRAVPTDENLIGKSIAGVKGTFNKVEGLHQRKLQYARELARINGQWLVTTDQLVWTSKGWSSIDLNCYTLHRFLSAEEIPSLNCFLQCIIDPSKMEQLQVGSELELHDGKKVLLSSIERLGNQAGTWTLPITDENQSYTLDGGLVVDGGLGHRLPRPEHWTQPIPQALP